MDIDKRILRIEYFKSRGPGGQRKNKKETAVRVTHLPTNLTVVQSKERSQAQNLKNALICLDKKLKNSNKRKKRRIPTKLPAGIKEKILKEKKLKSAKKVIRKKIADWQNL